jgi:capsular polysaccharide biosynthesis protein
MLLDLPLVLSCGRIRCRLTNICRIGRAFGLSLGEILYMELQEYIRIVRRRGWIVILLAILVAGAAYVFSKTQPTIYESSVNLTVRPARADWGLSNTVGSLLRSLAGDITTHSFMRDVIDLEQLDTTTDDLLDGKTVFVTDEAADFTISIVVRDPSDRVAVQMVNAIADLFVEQREDWNQAQDKRDRIDVAIRDHARYASVYSPKTKINVLAGGVLGALIGVVIVFVMEWLEAGVVRSLEDMDRMGVAALGAIPVESGWRR